MSKMDEIFNPLPGLELIVAGPSRAAHEPTGVENEPDEKDQDAGEEAMVATSQDGTECPAGVEDRADTDVPSAGEDPASETAGVGGEVKTGVGSTTPKSRTTKRASKASKTPPVFVMAEDVKVASTGGVFELSRFVVGTGTSLSVQTEKQLALSAGKRLPKGGFIRGCSDPAMEAIMGFVETQNGTLHLTTARMTTELQKEHETACTIMAVKLVAYAGGGYQLWALRLPKEDGYLDPWGQSMWDAWEESLSHWVRVISNQQAGRYDCLKALGDLGEPVWPDKTFAELLAIGFKGRIIESMDHPVLRRLRGEIR